MGAPEDRARQIASMFGRIAWRYDLMNTLMTAGQDGRWRRIAVSLAQPPRDGLGLDVGAGTGKLAVALAEAMPEGRVVALDFSEPMVRHGISSLAGHRVSRRLVFQIGDALALPYRSGVFDCVVTAFTVRNVLDVRLAFAELARVTRPGGRVVCLEIVRPPDGIRGRIFRALFGAVVPRLGALVAGDANAYSYLPESVSRFLGPEELAEVMRAAGLERVHWRLLGLGTVGAFVGISP